MADSEITIGNYKIELTDAAQVPIAIDYQLEDIENFQSKTSGQAIGVMVPATLINADPANSFEYPSIEDLTDGQLFRNPVPCRVKWGGVEILVGKAILNTATHTDKPEKYEFNFFGDNADWVTDMQTTTLYDILSILPIPFDKQSIINSWAADGTSEALPYVYAPARYTDPMGKPDPATGIYDDYNMLPEYMRPALFKYWLLYWGFKKLGYRISSEFMNTAFFRRQVLPWTWGGLSAGESRTDNLRFLAKSDHAMFLHANYTGYLDVNPTNDSTNGGFDNNDCYHYDRPNVEMVWTYKPDFNYGNLDAYFDIMIDVNAGAQFNGKNNVHVEWYKVNGQGRQLIQTDLVYALENFTSENKVVINIFTINCKVNVNPTDQVIAKITGQNFHGPVGSASMTLNIVEFTLNYFRVPLGGAIDLANYNCFKNYLFLDLLRGVVDEFNLSFKTDATTKTVLIEPTHAYVLPGETVARPGYFNMDFEDWSGRFDLSKEQTMTLFSAYNRTLNFRYRADTNDTLSKVVQNRYATVLASARYLLPARFQVGTQDFENRFFSACMHYDVQQWGKITGTVPQMMSLVSESSSNISKDNSQTILQPKSAYYKGLIQGLGWNFDGVDQMAFPFMFGVNYMPGGDADPVLSYSDEKIGNDQAGYVVVPGLLRKFFLQRMANMRNGQWYDVWVRLDTLDVAVPWHREFKTYMGHKWELITINQFKPGVDDSTQCTLRKWVPIAQIDSDNTFPSQQSILQKKLVSITNDIIYYQLKGLWSDVPK